MQKRLLYMAAIIFFAMISGCGNEPNPFTEATVVVASNQSVKVAEVNLTITNNGCGREWVSEDGSPAFEKVMCKLVIKHKDSTIVANQHFSQIYFNNLKVQVDKMNPWGKEEDGVPPGGCRIIVTQLSEVSR
jgi:hypothetical protein